jgi:hypothetical protein
MPVQFQGGPLAGKGMMTDEEMQGMGPPEGAAPPEGGGDQDESAMFSTLLETIRGLLSLGTVSEQNKLALEKASTLVQQIKASEEKEGEAAMGGKLSPGIMRKLGGGGAAVGGAGGGY